MNSGLLTHRLSDSDLDKILAVSDAADTNFVHLAAIAGLDRAKAWRHLNLTGSDFSDCDLRGFDFTGADLTGCIGANVLIDDTTILDGAELGGSIFELRFATAAILRGRPDLQKEYYKIQRAHCTEQHNWVFDILNRKVAEPETRRTLALSLYFDAKDAFVRRTILYFLVFQSRDQKESLGFLARFISEAGGDTGAIITALTFLARTYKRSEQSALLLFAIAEDERQPLPVRHAATAGLLMNDATARHSQRAGALVRAFKNRTLDNLFIRLVAEQLSYFHVLVVGAGKLMGGLNFQDSIREADVVTIVNGLWGVRHELRASSCLEFHSVSNRTGLIPFVLDRLSDLRNRGLPLKLDFGLRPADPIEGEG